MALTVEHVKANDPKALRAEITALKKQIEYAPPSLNDQKVLAAVAAERDAYKAERDRYRKTFDELSLQHGRMWRAIKSALDAAATAPALPNDEPEPMALPPEGAIPFGAAGGQSPSERFFWDDTNNRLGPFPSSTAPKFDLKVKMPPARAPRDGSVRMLIALAEMHPTPLTYRQLGTLGVMKVTGGSFPTYLSRLATQGYITKEGGLVHLTEAGRRAAGQVQKPATARELLAMWREKLPGKAADMLEWLAAERVPKTRSELADFAKLEIRGGTFPTYLSKLTSNGLAERAQGNRLRAVKELWLR